ncbi:MAG TPA: hypothetical protein VEK15_32860 [Vicinamibacteria bacterium]|nr:hypothetical protein [Vicinamibacteria bacterium]
MNRSHRLLAPLLVVVGGSEIAHAKLLTDDYLADVREAFAHMYNLDYESSLAGFEELRDAHPGHPGPHLDLAIVVWQRELFRRRELRLDRFVSPGQFSESTDESMPEAARRAFESHIAAAERLATARLDADPDDPDGLYYLGEVRAIQASFALTIERDKIRSFKLGRRAHELHYRLVELDRSHIDAYLTLGTYEYIVDDLPWYVKWLATLVGFQGDEERGLDFLKTVAERGRRARDVARVLTMVLLVREEQLESALELAVSLEEDFPKNYLFALNRIEILEKMDRDDEAVEQYRRLLDRTRRRHLPDYVRERAEEALAQ